MDDWFEAFPVPEESPAHHFRAIRMTIRGINWFPDKFFEHAPRFTNVRKLHLFGGEDCLGSQLPSLWRLPESITSLTIDFSCRVSDVAILDIMTRLPNLDDLSLWGASILAERAPLRIGTVPRGRFGGELAVHGVHYGCTHVMKMLLEIPTVFRFTKVEVDCAREYIPSVIRLAEGCSKTILKLSLSAIFNGKYHPFSWPDWLWCGGYDTDATTRHRR